MALIAGCTTSSPSPSLAPPATASSEATVSAIQTESPSPRPTVSAGPFVAANVEVLPQAIAKVHGSALAIAAPDDGSGRLFVATQEGQIWSIGRGPAYDLTPMLDIADRITSGGERGLLGLALHPDFATYPRAYVNYTDLQGDTVIASFTAAAGNPARLDPASEQIILRQPQPFAEHNGGGVDFGP